MNILLLYPEFPDTFWSFKHALKFIGKKAFSPPLGLLTVAAMLPREWNLRLVDLNIRPLTNDDLAWADYAFISAMAVQGNSARKAIARCKLADVPVVGGGPLFTVTPDEFADVDHLVLGEAEISLPPFLADLASGKAKHTYEQVGWADMAQTPLPRWDLADLRRYAVMCLQFSRGCPFACDFCNVTSLLGRLPRHKSSAQILAELNHIQDSGFRGDTFFVDDNLIGNPKYLKTDLLPAMIGWQKERGPLTFNTQVSINMADDEEMMRLMGEAGFDTVFVGIETPDDLSLNECAKNQNKGRNMVEDVRRIQRAGFEVQAGFIVGFDHDTPAVFDRQLRFIQASGIPTAMVGMLQAPAGTKLYERMEREGRLIGQSTGDNVDGTTNIVPTMGLETLQQGYEKLINHLYSPSPYYRRVKTFLAELGVSKVDSPGGFKEIMALFRSMLHLGLIGQERFQYWKLLTWTALRCPGHLPLAVNLAIVGHHCRRICELHVSGSKPAAVQEACLQP